MMRGSKTLAFLINQSGTSSDAKFEIVARLKKRLDLQEVDSVNKCDVIIAFVSVLSRAGTDIDAALQFIPRTQPVVLIVLHHTFDENFIAQSKWCVKRDGVFAADFLCYEDIGLLKCLTNDKALKSITDYLISVPPSTPLIPVTQRRRRCYWTHVCAVCVACALISALIVLFIYLPVLGGQGQNDTLTTPIPNVTNYTETEHVTKQVNITVTTDQTNNSKYRAN